VRLQPAGPHEVMIVPSHVVVAHNQPMKPRRYEDIHARPHQM